jgi:L-fucose isomerase-like protein
LLQKARIGVVGEHPDGMDTCHLDAQQLKEKIGVSVKQYSLQSLFERMGNVEPVAVESSLSGLGNQLSNISEVDQEPLDGTIRAYHVLRETGQEDGISGFAVRCWPEFFEQQGCAACGAMSLLNDLLIPSACEADVNGALTQLILQWMSGKPAFGADVVSVDIDEDLVVIWHCGNAPLSMADPGVQAEAGIHSNRNVPLVMEFPLKPGRVTAARLSRATGSLRLVVGGGEILQAPKSFSGTSGVIRFDNPAEMIKDTILGEWLEHHIAITYGDHVPAMQALADLLNLPVLQL